MKIDVLTIGGSIIGFIPEHVESPGVGGSELMLYQWAKSMVRRGHEITIYNTPERPGRYDGILFAREQDFVNTDYRDVLISFRGPKLDQTIGARFGIAVGWSADQFEKSYQEPWYGLTDGLVGISEFHRADHRRRCSLTEDRMRVIEIGSDPEEYPVRKKIPFQFIYNSLPARGLIHLAGLWPMIRGRYPLARLLITSDYKLSLGREAGNEEYRAIFDGMEGVEFLGSIPRSELVCREAESEIHLYPCTYEELFCISSSEAQMAGCYGITSSVGALPTTNFTGYVSPFAPGSREFSLDVLREIEIFYGLSETERATRYDQIREAARKRFDWGRICEEWERYFSELFLMKSQ